MLFIRSVVCDVVVASEFDIGAIKKKEGGFFVLKQETRANALRASLKGAPASISKTGERTTTETHVNMNAINNQVKHGHCFCQP